MDRFHRIYVLNGALSGARVAVSRRRLKKKLECGTATLKRIEDLLRGYSAPIEYVRQANGYRYTPGAVFQLPGI